MPRRLIVCADGTWNDPSAGTNVYQISRRIPHSDEQVVFYHRGLGTEAQGRPPQSALDRFLNRVGGGAFGAGLSGNVQDVYRWVANTYQPGDELWFFGFSRGAFTVRSAVGFIRKVGLLPAPVDEALLREGYDLYRRKDPTADSPAAVRFRERNRTTTIDRLDVAFIGVWDTVGALGVPGFLVGPISRRRWGFHDHRLSSYVKRAYHAVAADELRAAYLAALWSGAPAPGQAVEQVWFAGRHSEVGGRPGRIALRWMAEKAQEAGLVFSEPIAAWRPPPGEAPCTIGPIASRAWRLLGGQVTRPIGDPAYPGQAIHPSLDALYDANDRYRRENLSGWREGKPLAAPIGRKWWYTLPATNGYYLRQYDATK